jgi:hypothetical protein
MSPPRAYLDTCIVSGLANDDLSPSDTSALHRILKGMKAGRVELVTSDVAATEINQIPEAYRMLHAVIYNLLADVPTAATHRTDSGLTLMGVGGGRREDPLFTDLKKLLPDARDAEHVFQAAKNDVAFLITVDRRSFLSHSAAVAQLCHVQLITPVAFEQAVLATKDPSN